MAITDRAIQALQAGPKPYKCSDEKSLYLLVTRSGSKLWRFGYRFGGKDKDLPLGPYPEVSLKAARIARDVARQKLADGIDPAEERKQQKAALKLSADNSFQSVSRAWFETRKSSLVPEYAEKVIRSLEVDVFPYLGTALVNDITPPQVLAVLRRIEARGALETLKRVRQRCQDVFSYAIACGLREKENPVLGLEKALKTRTVRHRASIPARDLREFYIRLDAARISLPVKHAIRLIVLTFLRPSEIRCARWVEIDIPTATWIVPAERDRSRRLLGMKMKREHLVPLSTQAVGVFQELRKYSGGEELVFPNRNDCTKPMSDGTINSALRAMGYTTDEVTGSGFRTTAASALAEMGFRKEVIDRQLSHAEKNQVLAAYIHQAEYEQERRQIMQVWGDYLENLMAEAKTPSNDAMVVG